MVTPFYLINYSIFGFIYFYTSATTWKMVIVDKIHCGQNKSQPTDLIFLPLTRAWGAEGCDEAGWGEAESHPEAGARVQRGSLPFHYNVHSIFLYILCNFVWSSGL